MVILAVFILALCWGSFLNVVAYRWVHGRSCVWPRSFCTSCQTTLYWFDLIPLVSWFLLGGKCRFCALPISWLYPFIELCTAIAFVLLWVMVPHHYFIAYAVFFSALLITVRTDLEKLLIFRLMTWGIIPIGLVAAWFGRLPLSWIESLLGAVFGYCFLWLIRKLFWWRTKKEGLGLGDLDLLAAIGSFTGVVGAWISLVIGSLASLSAVIIYMFLCLPTDKKQTIYEKQIPFGPFLALGALAYVIAGSALKKVLLGLYS